MTELRDRSTTTRLNSSNYPTNNSTTNHSTRCHYWPRPISSAAPSAPADALLLRRRVRVARSELSEKISIQQRLLATAANVLFVRSHYWQTLSQYASSISLVVSISQDNVECQSLAE